VTLRAVTPTEARAEKNARLAVDDGARGVRILADEVACGYAERERLSGDSKVNIERALRHYIDRKLHEFIVDLARQEVGR
jgi:hypothetical protein